MLSIFGSIFLKSISDQIISGQYYRLLIQNRGQNRKTKVLIWKRITYHHRFRLSNGNQGFNETDLGVINLAQDQATEEDQLQRCIQGSIK